MRNYFLAAGPYNWTGDQAEVDKWAKDMDVTNYQRTIVSGQNV